MSINIIITNKLILCGLFVIMIHRLFVIMIGSQVCFTLNTTNSVSIGYLWSNHKTLGSMRGWDLIVQVSRSSLLRSNSSAYPMWEWVNFISWSYASNSLFGPVPKNDRYIELGRRTTVTRTNPRTCPHGQKFKSHLRSRSSRIWS